MKWTPGSWLQKTQQQSFMYPDPAAAEQVLLKLRQLPPLVASLEVNNLKTALADCVSGKSFLLQGGDCAESFADCQEIPISNKLKILLQMSLILLHGLHKPILRVGRIAGQYAKPRSQASETIDGKTLPSFRGDIINGAEFTESARIPDPQRMLQAYYNSGLTLNYLRALLDGGFADLNHPEYWNLDFVKHTGLAVNYQHLVTEIGQAMRFLHTVGGLQLGNLRQVDFYTSHEALHLPYEQALTRRDEKTGRYYNLGAHFLWIGMRTLNKDNAHLEYARGIGNPLGVKVSPEVKADALLKILDVLDPDAAAGKINLIHRMGATGSREALPPLIKAVQRTGRQVLWTSDPMHGNTKTTAEGIKTRYFSDILSELKQAFAIHAECGSVLGGVHFELTGDNVTECIGGAGDLKEADLSRAYKSLVDPRLNYEQALEMAMLIAEAYKA